MPHNKKAEEKKLEDLKRIVFPSFESLDKLSVSELALIKQKVEYLESYIAARIRSLIQN